MRLLVANKNYSSWSLRAWLLFRHAGIAFEEEKVSFNAPDFAERIARYSPAGRVPVLIDGDLAIWDTLAIAEYVAEKFPDKQLWPADRAARARARSLCAEMHAGFGALRTRLPLNVELSLALTIDNEVRRDITRIHDMWSACRREYGGPFLFGAFSIADAYFAPVVLRFASYGVTTPEPARAWVDTMLALPALQAWIAEAKSEHEFVADDEHYRTKRS